MFRKHFVFLSGNSGTIVAAVLLLFFSAAAQVFGASASITEIMYDLSGSDSGREWIEIKNTDVAEAMFSQWKFFEGDTNHSIVLFRGTATSSSGGVAIIADDPDKFLIDLPNFSGTLFKSSFSLGNSGETIAIKFDGVIVDEVAYASTTGAAGDGNSLQKKDGGWSASIPTPGVSDLSFIAVSGVASQVASTSLDSPVANTSSVSQTVIGAGGGSEPLKPNLFVYATAPARTVAGADAIFEVVALGVKKEPVLNARYIWSFGDGGTVEGKKVLHAYHYPGNYAVLVEASSGEWSATDRKDISVLEPLLSIVRVKEGVDGFIEVLNSGNYDLDLSRWFLQSNQTVFSFPIGTILKARQSVLFPAEITKISAADNDTTAVLYSNGKIVARYAPRAELPVPIPSSPVIPLGANNSPVISQAPVTPIISSASIKKSVVETVEENRQFSFAPSSSASSSEFLLASVQTSGVGGGIGVWIATVSVLLGVSVVGYAFSFRTAERELTGAEKLKKEAEAFEIIE